MKILTFIFTFGINIAVAFVLFFFLLLALNGFSEKDANWRIYLYGILVLLSAILTGLSATFLFGYLVNKKQKAVWAASLISISTFVITGAISNFVCVFLGAIMAEIRRVNF